MVDLKIVEEGDHMVFPRMEIPDMSLIEFMDLCMQHDYKIRSIDGVLFVETPHGSLMMVKVLR